MTDCIQVPVEPTPEMLEAGADWCGQGLGTDEAKGRAVTAYKAMLAAAPAVQGEPVARHHATVCYEDCLCEHGSGCKLEAECGVTVPLYTALQPVEQQPVPDVSALVEALEAALMVMTSKEVRLEKQADAITMVRSQLAAHRKGGE